MFLKPKKVSSTEKIKIISSYSSFDFSAVYDRMIYFDFDKEIPDLRMFPLLYESLFSRYSNIKDFLTERKYINTLPQNLFALCFQKGDFFSYETISYIAHIIGPTNQRTDNMPPRKIELDHILIRNFISEAYTAQKEINYLNYYFTIKMKDQLSETKSDYFSTENGIIDFEIRENNLWIKQNFGEKTESTIELDNIFSIKIENRELIVIKRVIDNDIIYQIRKLEELLDLAELYNKPLKIDFHYR